MENMPSPQINDTETVFVKGPDGHIFTINLDSSMDQSTVQGEVVNSDIPVMEFNSESDSSNYVLSEEAPLPAKMESVDSIDSLTIGAGIALGGIGKFVNKRRLHMAERKLNRVQSSLENRNNSAQILIEHPNADKSRQPKTAKQARSSAKTARKAHKAREAHGNIQLRNFATSSGKPHKPNELGVTTHNISEIHHQAIERPYFERTGQDQGRLQKKQYEKLDDQDEADREERAHILHKLEAQASAQDRVSRRKTRSVSKLQNKITQLRNNL